MELNSLTTEQLKELTIKTEEKDALRVIAENVDVTFSGNTGPQKLKENILTRLDEILVEEAEAEEDNEIDEDLDLNDPVAQALLAQNQPEETPEEDVHVTPTRIKYTNEQLMEMDSAQVKDAKLRKAVIRAQSLRLRRVRITNLDPADDPVPGAIVSVISKYTGKVAKFIPYDQEVYENGYHVPQIILDDLSARTFYIRKEDRKNSKGGIKKYTNINQKKFIIEYLPDLTPKQLKSLAQEQSARNAIDRTK